MAACSQALSRRLGVPVLETDIYSRSAKPRRRPLLSAAAGRSLLADVRFVSRLRRLGTAVHLSNQHLARYGPVAGAANYLVTVHDIIRYLDRRGGGPLIHRPNLHDKVHLDLDVRGIARAQAVITPSAATRDDVIRHLDVPEERVFVVHNGIDLDRFQPRAGRDIGRPYVLFVGSSTRERTSLPCFMYFAFSGGSRGSAISRS